LALIGTQEVSSTEEMSGIMKKTVASGYKKTIVSPSKLLEEI
jgi:hypothetical protein